MTEGPCNLLGLLAASLGQHLCFDPSAHRHLVQYETVLQPLLSTSSQSGSFSRKSRQPVYNPNRTKGAAQTTQSIFPFLAFHRAIQAHPHTSGSWLKAGWIHNSGCPSADRTAAEVPECLSGPGPLLCCMEWRWGWEKAERAWASGGITNAMTSAVLPALKNDQPRRGSVAAARLSLSVCVKGLSQYNAAKG